MEKVSVKVIANHHGGDKMYYAGDTREVYEDVAGQLKGHGLVEWSGKAIPPPQGQHILLSDKPKEEARPAAPVTANPKKK